MLRVEGPERAGELLKALLQQVRHDGVSVPGDLTTPYLNTIETAEEPPIPGERKIEHSLRSLVRWNAMAIVLQANRSTSRARRPHRQLPSAATLYEVGFNHFWHAPYASHGGDLVYIQGHSAPGIYARAFLEGRLAEQQLAAFARRSAGTGCPPTRTRG